MKKKFRNIKKLPDWIYTPLAWVIKIWYLTMRKEFIGSYDPDKVVIQTLWHNRLLFCAMPFVKSFRNRTYCIASSSRDGQYITDLMCALGVNALRGSSSKHGIHALRGALKVLKAGNNVSLTPDGPRGPKYTFSSGAILMASKTGVPIQPFSINAEKYWELKSWDNFQIPKPFTKLQIHFGELIEIPQKLSEEEFEQYRLKLEEANKAIAIDQKNKMVQQNR